MIDLTLTKYDIFCGILFFIINLIFLFANIGIFNNMNKYIAFPLILFGSILYTILNRILFQLIN
jgi:hypothetical protein